MVDGDQYVNTEALKDAQHVSRTPVSGIRCNVGWHGDTCDMECPELCNALGCSISAISFATAWIMTRCVTK